MLFYKIFKQIYSYLIYFIFVQLFLFCISLPILTNWGLSFSMLNILGNLLFTPLLTIQLCLSFFIFFTEILNLPNFFLINLLEYITKFWLFIMEKADSFAIFYIPKISWQYSVFFILVAFGILVMRWNIKYKILFLLIIIILTITTIKISTSNNIFITKITCSNRELLLVKIRDKNILLDNTVLSRCKNIEQWSYYTLKSELNILTGRPIIDMLIVLNPTKASLKKSALLLDLGYVKKIEIISDKN